LFSIHRRPLPEGALLARYIQDGAYTDCYATDISDAVTHARYVAAFYTTALFKLERFILRWVASRPSTDAQAEQLATGATDSFAAWHVEAQAEHQLLLSDLLGRTRSWLMVAPLETGNGSATRLYFGSAVVAVQNARSGKPSLGPLYRALLGFHKLYSQALLHAAKARLLAARN
jgi:hypothetical protein